MEYREIVDVLSKFHKVGAKLQPTFRTRIHVLRKMGVPPVAKVGKGSRATFSLNDLTELHLGLTLGEFGFTPTRIADVMQILRGMKPYWPLTRWGDDAWLIVTTRAYGELKSGAPGDSWTISIKRDGELADYMKRAPNQDTPTWHAVLNLGRIAEKLNSVADQFAQ